MTPSRRKPQATPKAWQISYRNPFGFPMNRRLRMVIVNSPTTVKADAVICFHKGNYMWLPTVLRLRNGEWCDLAAAKRAYIAKSSAVLAAELYLRYVRALPAEKPPEPEEVQLMLPFLSNSFAMAV